MMLTVLLQYVDANLSALEDANRTSLVDANLSDPAELTILL